MVNANSIFNPTDLLQFKRLTEINDQLKALESEKKLLTDAIKSKMESHKISECIHNGTAFKLSVTERHTIRKGKSDEFIAELIAKNKTHLVITDVKPDMESIFLEVDAGLLSKDFVEQFVTVTPVKTLRTS